jgi:hypothetical protein
MWKTGVRNRLPGIFVVSSSIFRIQEGTAGSARAGGIRRYRFHLRKPRAVGTEKVKRWGTWLRFWLTHARFPNNVLDCGCRSGMVVHGHAVSRFRAQFSESEEAAQREDSKSLKETLALGSGFKVGSDERRK